MAKRSFTTSKGATNQHAHLLIPDPLFHLVARPPWSSGAIMSQVRMCSLDPYWDTSTQITFSGHTPTPRAETSTARDSTSCTPTITCNHKDVQKHAGQRFAACSSPTNSSPMPQPVWLCCATIRQATANDRSNPPHRRGLSFETTYWLPQMIRPRLRLRHTVGAMVLLALLFAVIARTHLATGNK